MKEIGVYQIYAKAMQEDGMGSLFEAYEQLKDKLSKEGLFDEKYKKKIPLMPRIIGVLTSNTGAVIRDIINVSTRRNPNVYIRLLPVPVQGVGAGEKIAKAIKIMNEKKLADVIIVARGGGSIEDLWPFNEEIVARAIYDSELPIISAVGHETDFTIADFAADLRAPTPSAAAELAVADVSELEDNIQLCQRRLKMSLKRKTEIMRLRYEKCMTSRIYKEPLDKINDYYLQIDSRVKEIANIAEKKLKDSKIEAIKLITKLDTLSPLKTLTRGYTLTECEGKVITKASSLEKDMIVDIRFQDGSKKAKVM